MQVVYVSMVVSTGGVVLLYRQYTMAMEERERTIQHAIEQAEYSQAKHKTYLKETVNK